MNTVTNSLLTSLLRGPYSVYDVLALGGAIVIDTETTGLRAFGVNDDGTPTSDPHGPDRLCSIALVKLWQNAVGRWVQTEARQVTVNPQRPVGERASAVNGMVWRKADLAPGKVALEDEPTFSLVADEILDFIGDLPIVAHNSAFDIAFLDAELVRVGRAPLSNALYCTKKAFSDLRGEGRPHHYVPGTNLNALCDLLGVDRASRLAADGTEAPHSALVDAELTAACFDRLSRTGWLKPERPDELPHRALLGRRAA